MNPIFSKQESNIIKGIGILLMFFLHFFCYPEWWVGNTYYPSLVTYSPYLKISLTLCVAIYAFLTGYLYFYSKKKTLRHSLRKSLIVYLGYWMIFLPLFLVSVISGTQEFSVKNLLLQLFALDSTTVKFNWYVLFFLVVMLLLPLLDRFLFRHAVGIVIFGFLIPILGSNILTSSVNNSYVALLAVPMRNFFPCVTLGWVLARYGVFDRVLGFVSDFVGGTRVLLRVLVACLSLLLMAGALVGQYFANQISLPTILFTKGYLQIDIPLYAVFVTIFVLAVLCLFRALPGDTTTDALRLGSPEPINRFFSLLRKALAFLGEKSLMMWLFSSMFFGVGSDMFQHLLYWPGKAILVYIWGILICLLAAWVLDLPLKALRRK